MATIYCIPGTGVDKRIFSRLELQGHEIRHIKWLLPYKKEELEAYALRLGKQIDPVKPFVLLGVSFGGMLSVALARHLHPDRIIIVSSCKSRKEL
ncbi:MAG TPA: alpha/beta hydrolase, partial [Bacteroidia bacterium]|nr:alpha/beta hydrolase [Bacteroidia bacterium]